MKHFLEPFALASSQQKKVRADQLNDPPHAAGTREEDPPG
jgi:hypothetical protein